MTVKICISIPPQTAREALSLIESAEKEHADFIEVRLDYLKEHDQLHNIALSTDTPLIATNRTTNCQGRFSGSELQRQKTLLDAARDGFEYVDVELSTPKLEGIVNDLHESGARSIVSFHNFEETPSPTQLNKILVKEVTVGADICKIATTARLVSDNLVVLDFVSRVCNKNLKLVCFSMGELGKASRFLAPIFGAFFTIASLKSGRNTADGQLTIQEMRTAYDVLGIQ